MKRIEKVFDELGYGNYDWHKNKDGTWYGLFEFWTDTAGQDVVTEIEFNGTV